MEALVTGRLAYLHFEDDGCCDCLGYVDASGKAEWPDSISGLLPDGWCNAVDILWRQIDAGSGSIRHSS
ncbi:hypothetical protein ACQKKX_07310 [Neorhizobium sp. NPDC001467]|uniref:hypothetical protein n=1 Tax=Neorhizobium sp. NPDC001467 TaxID=3390595 RepID=UPI003CFD8A3D